MSHGLPDQIDVWRLVSGRNCFAGELPLRTLSRLGESLAQTDGNVSYQMEFGTDDFDQAFVELAVQGNLPLVCQRTLEVYQQPVTISLRLGLIRREDQEAALPPGYEPCLVPHDGMLALADLIEDELILALPLVPARPDSGEPIGDPEPEPTRDNPFAALKSLKLQ